mgnify:CR=1 FL=1
MTRIGDLLGGKSAPEPTPAEAPEIEEKTVVIKDEPKVMDLEESDGADVLTEDKPEEKKGNAKYNFIRE